MSCDIYKTHPAGCICQLDYWVAQAQLYAYYRGFIGVTVAGPSGTAVVWFPSDGMFDLSATATRIDRNNSCGAAASSANDTNVRAVPCSVCQAQHALVPGGSSGAARATFQRAGANVVAGAVVGRPQRHK